MKIRLTAVLTLVASISRADVPIENIGEPFGNLPLVDDISCGDPQDGHPVSESKPGVSHPVAVLGRHCRAMKPGKSPAWFAYRIGQGRGLVARGTYVLAIDYPEDAPRTLVIVNRGAGTTAGLHTGATLGDPLWSGGTPGESLTRVPLAGGWRTARYLFTLADHTADLRLDPRDPGRPLGPADGFWVAMLQPSRRDDPLARGAAVARIRLFAVAVPATLAPEIRYPPAGLPRRHIVLRSSADRAFHDLGPAAGMDNPEAWFEGVAQRLRFLGVNTWSTALLVDGHNAGWDTDNDDWFAPAPDSLVWDKQLQLVERYGFDVLPYFEYGGSRSLNAAVPVRTLRGAPGKPYTDVPGGEPFHADVTDPRTLEDIRAVVDHTLVRFKDQNRFVGAWFRTRTAQWPVSFADGSLERFSNEANGGNPVTRDQVAADPALRARYGEWWLGARRRFAGDIADYLRTKLGGAPQVLVTPWAADAGPSLSGAATAVVTDDRRGWEDVSLDDGHGRNARLVPLRTVLAEHRALKGATAWVPGRGAAEWTYAMPRADPERWRDRAGLSLTVPVRGLAGADDPALFDAFRGPDGVAAVRFQANDEALDGGLLGGVSVAMERSGPFSMLEEAHAVATADPVLLATLSADGTARAFPEVVRRFHAAYLALPALSSSRLEGAASDAEVVVRSIVVESQGTWLAVVNTGFVAKPGVTIHLPADGTVTDAATGADLASAKSGAGAQAALTLALDPCELRAILIVPKKDQ